MFLFLLKLEKWFKWNDRKRIYHTFPEMQEHFRKNPRYNPPPRPAQHQGKPVPPPKRRPTPFHILWFLTTEIKNPKPHSTSSGRFSQRQRKPSPFHILCHPRPAVKR